MIHLGGFYAICVTSSHTSHCVVRHDPPRPRTTHLAWIGNRCLPTHHRPPPADGLDRVPGKHTFHPFPSFWMGERVNLPHLRDIPGVREHLPPRQPAERQPVAGPPQLPPLPGTLRHALTYARAGQVHPTPNERLIRGGRANPLPGLERARLPLPRGAQARLSRDDSPLIPRIAGPSRYHQRSASPDPLPARVAPPPFTFPSGAPATAPVASPSDASASRFYSRGHSGAYRYACSFCRRNKKKVRPQRGAGCEISLTVIVAQCDGQRPCKRCEDRSIDCVEDTTPRASALATLAPPVPSTEGSERDSQQRDPRREEGARFISNP